MLHQRCLMLKKLLGLLAGSTAATTADAQSAPLATLEPTAPGAPSHPADEALQRLIAERIKTDPLIGAKLGGKEVFERLLRALAGYACQASLRATAVARGLPEVALLTVVGTRSGHDFCPTRRCGRCSTAWPCRTRSPPRARRWIPVSRWAS
jgi:hypothetical protein